MDGFNEFTQQKPIKSMEIGERGWVRYWHLFENHLGIWLCIDAIVRPKADVLSFEVERTSEDCFELISECNHFGIECGAFSHLSKNCHLEGWDEFFILVKSKMETKTMAIKIVEREGETPHSIKAYLDQYVINQDNAKKRVAQAVYRQYLRNKRLDSKEEDQVELRKSNVLLIGPTGVGKTEIGRTLARMLGVPFVIADASGITEEGYIGRKVHDVVRDLLIEAGWDVEKAQRGIIMVDEIDKCKKGKVGGSSRDVSGEGAQQAFLKPMEGTIVSVKDSPHSTKSEYKVDTSGILFIFAGKFEGLEKIVNRRIDGFDCDRESRSVGFTAECKSVVKSQISINRRVLPEDLVNFGLIPEFIGRIPIIAELDEIDEKTMVRIMKEPKNSLLKEFQVYFGETKMTFTEEALYLIAREAIVRKTGARGLRSIIERCVEDILDDLPNMEGVEECIIDRDVVLEKGSPKLVCSHKSIVEHSAWAKG